MPELIVPQALLDYLLGHPESALQENRVTYLVYLLDNLIFVHEHPVSAGLRNAVQARWAEITVNNLHKPGFGEDLGAAIKQFNSGQFKPTRKQCLAHAFLLMHTYREWWQEPEIAEVIQSRGLPMTIMHDPPGLDFSNRMMFGKLGPKGLDFLRRLKKEYNDLIDTYTVRLFAKKLWQLNNYPNTDAPEFPLNDEPTRAQWARWLDELGLDERILHRNPGGRRS